MVLHRYFHKLSFPRISVQTFLVLYGATLHALAHEEILLGPVTASLHTSHVGCTNDRRHGLLLRTWCLLILQNACHFLEQNTVLTLDLRVPLFYQLRLLGLRQQMHVGAWLVDADFRPHVAQLFHVNGVVFISPLL